MGRRKGKLTTIIIASIVLSLLFLSAIVQTNTAYADSIGEWSDFASTELLLIDPESPNSVTNPYKIESAEDLALLSNNVNNGENYINIYFIQTKDIDLDGHFFTPIGFVASKNFSGIYDGGNNKINNISIKKESQNSVGLFGNVNTTTNIQDDAGTIRNVNITSGTIVANKIVGGIVGSFVGKNINNCFANVVISNSGDYPQNVGGIAGINFGKITNCAFYGNINVPDGQDIGGIVGTNGAELTERSAQIEGCFNTGTIIGSSYVGGIAGSNYGTISNIYNTGDITADSHAAGLVGCENGSLSGGYSVGNYTFGTGYVGTIIGERKYGSDTERLYYNKSTSNTPDLAQHAIGTLSNSISNAVDDNNNDIVGLEFFEMINSANKMDFDQNKWATVASNENTGFAPYLLAFDITESEYSALALFGGDTSSPSWGGVSTPYQISNAYQLVLLGNNVNNNDYNYLNKFIELSKDIGFSNILDFQPIGIENNRFSAIFDGKGFEMSGLNIDTADDYVALFAYSSAYISDIKINNFNISGGDFVASLVSNQLYGKISQIYLSNCVINGTGVVGGVVANTQDCDIAEHIVNSTSLSGSKVGGLVGYFETGTLTKNAVDANINSTGMAGGIVAECFGATNITSSYFTGNLIGGSIVGGLVGKMVSGILGSSFVFVDEIVGIDFVGGLVGIAGNAMITMNYVIGNIRGENNVAGFIASKEGATLSGFYFSGDIDFLQNGYSTTNVGDYLSGVFYNSDTLTNDSTILYGEAKTSVELTNEFTGEGYFKTTEKEGLFGYFPQIYYFKENFPVISKSFTKHYYFESGEGTVVSPYQISEDSHLINMQRLIECCYNNYKDKYYQLKNDITLSKQFEPIASYDAPFLGRLNGNYYSIYNLAIDKADTDYVGLFSRIGVGAYIEKLNIRPVLTGNISGITGKNNVGAFAGHSDGYIWDCMNNIDVKGVEYIGGIAGVGGGISRSFNTGAITGDKIVGGIAGLAQGNIQKAFNSGYIKVNVEIGGGIAGIVGVYNSSKRSIENCYNSGDIESDLVGNSYVGTKKGGIVGQNDGIVIYCYNIGGFKGESSYIVGGIIGVNGSSEVSNSYYNKEIAVNILAIGDGNVGGTNVLALTTIQMIGSSALTNMTFSAGNYVSNEDRSMDADFAPQLILFTGIPTQDGENTEIVNIIKDYSKQSVMLRLFGRDVYNLMEWGGEHNPYVIATFDHLDTLSKQVEVGYTFMHRYFTVTSDIEMLESFLPIGSYNINVPTESIVFLGVFDGGGYTISNLVVGSLSSEYSQGLFGYIGEGSSVKNVIIGSGEVKGTEKVGSIVGYSLGEVSYCYSSANVEGVRFVGGIVGQIRSKTIKNAVFDGSVLGTGGDWGGIVGSLENTTAGINNCWYVLDINKVYSHNNIGSLLYVDKNGSVKVGVDYTAIDSKDFLYFEFNPDDDFDFDILNVSDTKIVFNTNGLVGKKFFPMYNNQAYMGQILYWYARFTKEVTIGVIENGIAQGDRSMFYEGQKVSIMVSPNIGYKVNIYMDTTREYTYVGDGTTIICSTIMGHESWEFTIAIVEFGTGETEIINPLDNKASIDSDSFEYDASPKSYNVKITDYTTIEEYYIVSDKGRIKEEAAITAGNHLLLIKLQKDNVIVGLKEIAFEIVPLKLTLDMTSLTAEEYTTKQYDKYASGRLDLDVSLVLGVVGADEILLTAERSYYNEFGALDANIGENKLVTFHNFILQGIGEKNYAVPDDIVEINGSIIKKVALVRIPGDILSKQFDANAPLISSHSFEGDFGDLFVNEFSFSRLDDLSNEGWNVGKYKIELTEDISGSKENYIIQFVEEYVFEITPRIISGITFSGYENLEYTGFSLNTEISATYRNTTNELKSVDIDFYHNNQPITDCINAGSYIAKAVISNENFLLDSEKSINFVISKINQPSPLILQDIQDNTYALSQVTLSLSGGDGDGAISYQVLQGLATISQGVLFINGAGTVVIKAYKEGSTNYLSQESNVVSFEITKGILTPVIDDIYISYGDTPIVPMEYSGYLRNEQGKQDIIGLIEPTILVIGDSFVVNEDGYEIVLLDNGRADGYNIDVTALTARLYVQKKQIHIEANAVSKIYGADDPILSFSILEDNTLQLVGEPNRMTGENAGSYLIEQHSLTSENNPNYNIVYIPRYFTISPKELRVSIPIYTKPYGVSDPEIDFLIEEDDLRMGDNLSVLSGSISRDIGEDVGQYAFRHSNVKAGINYTVRFTQVRYLQIQKATPTFTAAPRARKIVYGDTLSNSTITGEASVYGIFFWNDSSILPSVFNSQNTLYPATFVPTNSANYNNVDIKLRLVVEPRKVTVAFVGKTNVVYDGKDNANLVAVAYNVLDGDELDINIEYSQDSLVSAGSYSATASIDDINYVIDGNKTIYITIAKSQLNIGIKSATIVEGESYTPEIVYSGFKGIDTEDVLITKPRVLNVPTASGKYNLMLDGASADNYLIYYSVGKFIINKSNVKNDNITIEGTMPYNATISMQELNKKSEAFGLLKDFVSKNIATGALKGKALGSYNDIRYDDSLDEKMTFSVLMDIETDATLIIKHKDGSVEILKEYEYIDGVVVFTATKLSGIGVLRTATFYEKYLVYGIYAIIAVATIFIGIIIGIFVKKERIRKARLTPKFKD